MDIIDVHQTSLDILSLVLEPDDSIEIYKHTRGINISGKPPSTLSILVTYDRDVYVMTISSRAGSLSYVSGPDTIAINGDVFHRVNTPEDKSVAILKGIEPMPCPDSKFDEAIRINLKRIMNV